MVTRGEVLRYIFLPQFLPRLHELFGTGFAHLAFFIAQIYRAARLIPRGHPCLSIRNMGQYGIRDVMAIASSNLRFTKSTLDQVIVYFAIIAGLVMLVGQFFILLTGFLINPALAQTQMPSNYGGYFGGENVDPEQDIAYRLLNSVFGVPELFGAKGGGDVTAFHHALHGLFQIYSTGLLVVAVLIAIYFVVAVLAETAQTGTPFGKRFNHVWAPIRLVVGIGALIPLGYGLNSAQWVTLYAAKFGSNFASNGWKLYHETLKEEYVGKPETLVGTPQVPEFMQLPAFIMLAKTCKLAEEQKRGVGDATRIGGSKIEAFLVKTSAEAQAVPMSTKTWEKAIEFFNYGDIRIRFGSFDKNIYHREKGAVFPWCGDLILQTSSIYEPGSKKVQKFYYKKIQELWKDDFNGLPQKYVDAYANIAGKKSAKAPDPGNLKAQIYQKLEKEFKDAIKEAVKAQQASESWNNNLVTIDDKTTDIAKYGWGGAGVWYNKIAQINGDLMTAVLNVPRKENDPYVLNVITQEKLKEDAKVTSDDLQKFKLYTSDGRSINFPHVEDASIAKTLDAVYSYWYDGNLRGDKLAAHTNLTGNPFIDAINAIMGTQGLFDLCKNTLIHPLAQLSMAGKGIMEAAIRNLGFSVTGGALSGAASILSLHESIPAVLSAASSFYGSVASVGIIIGFVLFYIIPFLPFLYFFFAVGGWVKGIFEAMVGVPLWALAHLRIDGEGLPGDAAAAGYFLVFEIFVRPILVIFGLIASIAIFSAMAKVLNETFSLVVSNMSGFDVANTSCGESSGTGTEAPTGSAAYFRGPIDEFFFTIIYTIIVYMIGMSSFKLIDLIPNNILRWMGRGEASFGDQAGEPAEGLVQKMSTGGYAVSSSLQEAAQGLSGAVQSGVAGAKDMAKGDGQ